MVTPKNAVVAPKSAKFWLFFSQKIGPLGAPIALLFECSRWHLINNMAEIDGTFWVGSCRI